MIQEDRRFLNSLREQLKKYFPSLLEEQIVLFERLPALYEEWNSQINVISRKDIEHLFEKHILHSLAIFRFLPFQPGSKILDIGTGGGFPGIPLAISMPEVQFLLVDSIGKKIKVVNEVSSVLGLTNVRTLHGRAEEVKENFDFVVSRAVAPLPELLQWSRNKYAKKQKNALPNGLICLKGGDLKEEIKESRQSAEVYELKEWFPGEFFETKKLIYIAD